MHLCIFEGGIEWVFYTDDVSRVQPEPGGDGAIAYRPVSELDSNRAH